MHHRIAAFLTSLSLVFAAHSSAQERPPAPVTARLVEQREVGQRERVLGSVRAASEAVLAALEEGPVANFDLREGDAVATGAPLVVLDARRLEATRIGVVATRAEADAVRVQRDAELSDTREDLAALEAAAKSDAISARELRRARTLLASAEALAVSAARRLDALDAELALLDLRLHDTTLRAPFDGVIVERHVELGEWVKVGDPLVTLVSTGALEVWLDVPERFAGHLGAALNELIVQVGPTRTPYRASAPRSVPRVDPRSRTFPLIATLLPMQKSAPLQQGADSPLPAPGTSVEAWLPVGASANTLLVPKDALVYRPAGVAVMAVRGEGAPTGDSYNGTAALVPIVIRFETDREVAIQPGALEAGALVVTEGNERLFPGTPVSATIDRTPR